MNANDNADTNVNFVLKYPFEYRGANYTRFDMRRPRLRDLKKFSKEADKDAIVAMEKMIADLCEVDDKIVQELDLADFGPMKSRVEAFLNEMASDSDDI